MLAYLAVYIITVIRLAYCLLTIKLENTGDMFGSPRYSGHPGRMFGNKGVCEAEECLQYSVRGIKDKHDAYASVYNVAMLFVHYAAFVASTDSLLCRVCGIHCSQLLCRSSCDQTYSGLVSAMSSTPDASQFLRADKS